MALIESTELLESLTFLLKISREFRLYETSKAYEDIIRHIQYMENEILLEKGRFKCFHSYKTFKCMDD